MLASFSFEGPEKAFKPLTRMMDLPDHHSKETISCMMLKKVCIFNFILILSITMEMSAVHSGNGIFYRIKIV